MKKNNWFTRLTGLLLVSFLLLTATVAATGVGSSDDPLVTLSYLNQKFMPQFLAEVDGKIASRNETVSRQLSSQIRSDAAEFEEKYGSLTSSEGAGSGTADSFTLVTMSRGQTLYGSIGCEVMLRVGTASCVADSAPGLIDETTAGSIGSGEGLAKNHVYMMTIENRGVAATAESVKLLVRGSYSVR